eukprot:UN21211
MTQNKENFYGFILQLTFNCSFHAEAQATPKRTKYNMRKKKLTFIQLPFVFQTQPTMFWRTNLEFSGV